MKPIIIEMKDMSDSTEVYESRPNPLLTGFIYLILLMTVTAFVWMFFSKVDIVVKGTGTVTAAEEVATITNEVSGTILERKIEDGQKVQKGDVLYSVSYENAALQLAALDTQHTDSEEREEMLLAYQEWLEIGKDFSEELWGNTYFAEISSRKRLVELSEESTMQAYSGEMSAYEAKLSANEGMKNYYLDAITKSRQLIDAIKSRKNSFSSKESYYWNNIENYLAQYQYMASQYDDKIADLQKDKDAAEKEIQDLEAQKQELQEMQTLQSMTASVSAGDVTDGACSDTEQQIQGLEEQIASWKAEKENIANNISVYNVQKNNALNAYEKESIAAVESLILGYEQNLTAYEGTELEYSNGQNTLENQGAAVELNNIVTQEKHSVASELETCRQSQLQLQQQIAELQQEINNATVRATSDGYVNLTIDLVEGDYIAAGEQTLTIVPDTDAGTFIVKSYVENKDIAKVHEGMEVTYEISAYPSREYGTMKGEVTFVSPDLKVNNNGSAYYVVETSVDAGTLLNCLGEEASLKVGMLCETKIVVEEKRVLEVLIEKIFKVE